MLKFDYAILKYMPDSKRGEVVNFGLVIYLETGLDIRVLSSAAKLRLIDGESSLEDIESFKDSLKSISSYCSNKEDLHSLLQVFKGSAYVSDSGFFMIDHIQQYESKVLKLFSDLVKPYSIKERQTRVSRIHTILKHRFESMNLLAKDIGELSTHKVVHNYPINDKSGFTADFLLKNGRFHITEAIDFNVNDTNSKFKEATMKVMTFMEGKKFLGDDSACYFIYSATAIKEKEIIPHLNLASDYSDKVFNLESKEEETSYFNLISSLAMRDMPHFH
ncbi:hypothetical protein CXP40_04845 [Pseudomonas sp. YY-1]|uniref:DUF3037 domain-containing protein n=1 Tax=Pseudomonas sp. YY-1 TaxID=2058659 RepID=UPI000CB28AB4|nr:DUF3037 domain-containing protein [Pseudomonas sp. YY-1]PKQ42899.1 hypothetical protein CXP40_04845 [Pseudomonas sp. YY-1]